MSVSSQEQAVLTLVQEAVHAEISTSPDPTPWGRGRLTVVPSAAGGADKVSFLPSPDLAFWFDKATSDLRVSFSECTADAAICRRRPRESLLRRRCSRGEGRRHPWGSPGTGPQQAERVGEKCS